MLAAARRDGSNSPSESRTSTQEPEAPRASLGFPRRARITRGADLERIAQEGKRIRTVVLEVRAIASPFARPAGTGTRVGLVVPRYRHTAVARNRVKRRLRELVRTRLLPTNLAADIVIRIRPEAYATTFRELGADFERVMTQLRRWNESRVERTSLPSDVSPLPESGGA